MTKQLIKKIAVGFLLLAPLSVLAAPGLPHQFYGTVSYNNGSAPDGLLVEAKIGNTIVSTSQTSGGKFGYNPNLLFINDSNDGGSGDVSEGQEIKFYVGGIDSGETATFINGGYTQKDLSVSGSIGEIVKGASDTITNEEIIITPSNPTQIQMGDLLDITISSDSDTTATIETVEKLGNDFFSGSTAIMSGNNLLNGYEIKVTGTGLSITVTLHYSGTGIDISTIKPYRFDGTTWVLISPFTINTSAQTVTFNIPVAATPYVLFGQPATTSSGGGGSSGGGSSGGGGGGPSSVVAPTNISISINSGATKTNSRSVALTLGAINATQMAISNTADFVGIGWETFANGKTWNLTEGDGTKTVYAKFRSSVGGVSDVVSDAITYEAAAVIPPRGQVLGAETYNFGLQSLVMIKGSPDVFAVMNNVKRKIRSAEIFNSYSEWWGKLKIKTVTQNYLNSLSDTTLIKTSDSPNVYILAKGFKRLLASVEIFNSYGLDWNKIVTINQTEMALYSVAPLIKHNADLFWLDNGRVRHLFPSMESLTRNGYNVRDAIDVNDIEFTSFGSGIPISN